MKIILKKRLAAFAVAIACGLLGTAILHAAPGAKPSAKETRIEIKDFRFQPQLVTVTAGSKVVWVNKDEEPHTVVSTGKTFFSKALDTDDQFSYTFDKPGTYEYFCSVHPRMVAKIIVAPAKAKQP